MHRLMIKNIAGIGTTVCTTYMVGWSIVDYLFRPHTATVGGLWAERWIKSTRQPSKWCYCTCSAGTGRPWMAVEMAYRHASLRALCGTELTSPRANRSIVLKMKKAFRWWPGPNAMAKGRKEAIWVDWAMDLGRWWPFFGNERLNADTYQELFTEHVFL